MDRAAGVASTGVPMTDYTLPTSASALDIRAAYALAKVYSRFALGEHEAMLYEAMTAAEHHAWHVGAGEDKMLTCPVLFADEPALVASWEAGVDDYRAFLAGLEAEMQEAAERDAEAAAEAAYREALKTKPMPTGAELLARLLAGESVEVEHHRLNYDEGEGIWITNPYGVDAALLPATERACAGFIAEMREGVEYGPTPH